MKSLVINAGTPGDGTTAFLQKAPQCLKLCPAPATAVLSIGANDAVNPRMRTEFPVFRTNLRKSFDLVLDAGFALVVLTPPVICFTEFGMKYPEMMQEIHSGLEEKYHRYSREVVLAAREYGLPMVDAASVFRAVGNPGESEESLIRNKANSGAYDGIHPTPAGHILLGALVYSEIVHRRMPRANVICLGDSITHGYPLAGMGTVDGDNYPSALSRLLNIGGDDPI